MSGTGHTTDFPLVEQGYDPNEVDEYLATQMLQLRGQVDTATARVAELEAELAAVREREDAIQLTMVAATKARDELLAQAQQDADEILSKARREAFVTMTEARQDAEATIAEGKDLLDQSRRKAISIVTEAEEETQRLITEREQALGKLRANYEAEAATLIDRINTLRSISDDLVRSGATSSSEHAAEAADTVAAEPPPPAPQDPPPPTEGRTADAPQAEDVPVPEDDSEAPIADRIRGSFSGRRSAKLPRIGEEAGRSALAAASAMRAQLSHEPDDSDDSDDDGLAVRTA